MTSDIVPGKTRQPAILLDRVGKVFQSRGGKTVQALGDVSFDAADGSFVAVVGPSGCGKTTLLRLVDGLVRPDGGTVLVSGQPPRPGPGIGFVFQSFRLLPWRTVRANVEFALQALPLTRAERRERADLFLASVGLTPFADSFPAELSGGMRQRAALARALACEPSILLMDEPFASLDAQTRELMQAELMRIWGLRRPAVLFVTHSVDEAILLADKVLLMSPRPGRILEEIEVDLPRPRWEYDVRSEPRFLQLRAYLWDRIRDLVLSDPASEFFRAGQSGTS